MTAWVLITMICVRNCQPQYAEVYPTKEACMAKIGPASKWSSPDSYCVPLFFKEKNT